MSARQAAPAARRTPAPVYVWRFAVGHHLDGKRRTDATFLSRGTQALHPRWFGVAEASRWAMMPGWQRSALRLAVLAAAVGLAVPPWRLVTAWALALTGGPALGVAAYLAGRRVLLASHRARVVAPLAAALAGPLETTPAELARTLAVPRRIGPDAQVTAALPAHYSHMPGQADAAARIIGGRLGHEWDVTTRRDPLRVVASRRPDPPGRVMLAQVADLIRAEGSPTRILMGLGAGDTPVWLDFGSELAHLGLSVGTGGGKSAFLRFLLAQWAFHGVADFPTLDGKGVGLAGLETVPGVAIVREVAEQWEMLAHLRADMEARYARLLADPSAEFPLCVVLADEMNDFALESRAVWREMKAPRDPATPPVYGDLTRLLIKGRQCGYRFVGAWQRLTAASCGGLDAGTMRDALGSKALARFSPQAWDSLTGLRPRAESSTIQGRFVQVTGHDVRAVQVPYAEPAELLAFALSGTAGTAAAGAAAAVPVPPMRGPYPRLVAVGRDGTAAVQRGPERPSPASADPGLVVGLADAAAHLGMNLEAFRKARQRRPVPGETATPDGRPAWPAEALTAWRAARPSAAEGVAS